MTDTDKVARVKLLTGSTDADNTVSAYLEIASEKILSRAYPYDSSVSVVPAKYENLQCEIAAYLMNKRGAEGETAHSENGISRSYASADVPAEMLSTVLPVCGVI